jgi:hypothetical protein
MTPAPSAQPDQTTAAVLPSNKDKVLLLQKLSRIDQLQERSPEAQSLYLQLVYQAFLDMPRADVSAIEGYYMPGLLSKDPEMRAKFFSLWLKMIQPMPNLYGRMLAIHTTTTWEAVGGANFVKFALELLLMYLQSDSRAKLSALHTRLRPIPRATGRVGGVGAGAGAPLSAALAEIIA